MTVESTGLACNKYIPVSIMASLCCDQWLSLPPSTYLQQRYTKIHTFQRLAMDSYHEAFLGLPDGLNVLDYGSGPCVLATISAATKAESIVLSDYAPGNRKMLGEWLTKDPLTFDWTPYFDYVVRQLEGKGVEEVEKRQEDVRRLVKAVVSCDIFKDPPIEKAFGEPAPRYDVVMSSFTVCSAARSHAEYRMGVAKLGKLVKPGGVLMLYDTESTEDKMKTLSIGETAIRYVGVTRAFVVSAVEDAGLSDIRVRSGPLEADNPFGQTGQKEKLGYFFVQGVKA